ncbi:MAG: hypothetical protein ACD_60C00096G0003 [uncultured bacterium]|nr:MAG: hypothetical protein ACD_60C00096G0003 [uncultured bacterium]
MCRIESIRSRLCNAYFIAGFLSILLSGLAAFSTSVINPDAICYLQSAKTFPLGFMNAVHVCGQAAWPFYSMLIFGMVSITHLSYTAAAYVLNGLFSLISVVTFIAIVRLFTISSRIIGLAAFIILFAHMFNDLRSEIIRDHGYWAFYLVSLFFFLRYWLSSERFYFAVLWGMALIAATLFRIEGAIFLLLLPLTAFFMPRLRVGARIHAFLQLNILTFIVIAFMIFWILLHPAYSFSRLNEVQFQFLHGISELTKNYNLASHALALHVLSVYSARDTGLILFCMLVGWYITNVIGNVSLIYAVLIGYAWYKRISPFKEMRVAVWMYIAVNILITAVFLIDHLFLAKRYLMALSLVFMLWVPFALDDLLKQWAVRKWPVIAAVFFIVIFGISGVVHFGYSKQYIRDAGDWLAIHTREHAKIYSNDIQVLYYSNHFGNSIFAKADEFADIHKIANHQWQQYDYLALRTNKHHLAVNSPILDEIKQKPIVIFHNKRGDFVAIYQVHTNGS